MLAFIPNRSRSASTWFTVAFRTMDRGSTMVIKGCPAFTWSPSRICPNSPLRTMLAMTTMPSMGDLIVILWTLVSARCNSILDWSRFSSEARMAARCDSSTSEDSNTNCLYVASVCSAMSLYFSASMAERIGAVCRSRTAFCQAALAARTDLIVGFLAGGEVGHQLLDAVFQLDHRIFIIVEPLQLELRVEFGHHVAGFHLNSSLS